MKKTLILISLVITFHTSYSQKILNKRSVSKKLQEIEIEIGNNNFEKALSIFKSKKEVILEKKVRRSKRESYNHISSILSKKEELMLLNHNMVEKHKLYYENNMLCDATKLLSFNLSKENSFIESRNIYIELEPKLLAIKPECEKNSDLILSCEHKYDSDNYCGVVKCLSLKITPVNAYSITISKLNILRSKLSNALVKCSEFTTQLNRWESKYISSGDLEKTISEVLKLTLYDRKFIPVKDKKRFDTLREKLILKNKELEQYKSVFIYPVRDVLREIQLEELTYFKAQSYIEILDNFLNRMEDEPSLSKVIKELRSEAKEVISQLKYFSNKNEPERIDLLRVYNDFAGEGMFGTSIYTDVQKKYFWKKDYRGKVILGSGTVSEVSEKILGIGIYITTEVSSSHYVKLYLSSSEEKKIFGVYKGSQIRFMGEMEDLGSGIMFKHTIINVKILNEY